jgi:Putative zinc-finger
MVWHLSLIELLELRDGALTEKKSRRLKVHLEACPSCRSKASQIEENLHQSCSISIEDNSVASRLDAAATNLQRAIRTRHRAESADPEQERRDCGDNIDTREQLAGEIEAYLGPRLTAQLIREFDLGHEEDLVLFQKIGPTLTALLGQDASLEVATRLYRIMVLDRRSSSTRSNGSTAPVQGVEKA